METDARVDAEGREARRTGHWGSEQTATRRHAKTSEIRVDLLLSTKRGNSYHITTWHSMRPDSGIKRKLVRFKHSYRPHLI